MQGHHIRGTGQQDQLTSEDKTPSAASLLQFTILSKMKVGFKHKSALLLSQPFYQRPAT